MFLSLFICAFLPEFSAISSLYVFAAVVRETSVWCLVLMIIYFLFYICFSAHLQQALLLL